METISGKSVYKLAFTGKMGAGKTSASLVALGLLTEKYGPDYSIGYVIKFANPIYQSLLAFHRNDNPRIFKQRLGDLARREFGDDVFEKIFRENVEGLLTSRVPTLTQEHVLVMTDDLRFMKEYNLAKELGFTIVKIEADEEIRKERLGESFTNIKHRSEVEQELFEPDFVIYNNSQEVQLLVFETALKQLIEDNKLFGD